MQWLIDYFYVDGNLVKTFFGFFAFFMLFILILEICYVIRGATK